MSSNPLPPASALALEALADSLSACADELHVRLLRAIRAPRQAGGAPPSDGIIDLGISQAAAQALFENEVALRQRANGLYLDAGLLAVGGLGADQQQLLDLAALARDNIRKVERLKDLIDLTAELLALGAAIASGKPDHIAAPFDQIKQHLDALRQVQVQPPPPSSA